MLFMVPILLKGISIRYTVQNNFLQQGTVVPIVDQVLEGYNCTIFCYGQTGTGKTYTMEGAAAKDDDKQSKWKANHQAGALTRVQL